MPVTICCLPRAERWRRDRIWDRVLRNRLRESGNWDWIVERFAKFRRVVVLEEGEAIDKIQSQILKLRFWSFDFAETTVSFKKLKRPQL